MPQPPDRDAKSALIAALEARLGTALGPRLTLLERLIRSREPVPLALAWLLLYAAGAAIAIWWSNHGRMPEGAHAKLASLLVWDALHFPVLIAIARLFTTRSLEIVSRDILPFASEGYAAAVRAALAAQDATIHKRLAPPAVAAVVLAASLWALSAEIAPAWSEAGGLPPDLLYWAATVLLLSYLQMRVVVAGTFPRAFAAALELDRQRLYPPDAADTPLVRGLARLNRALLAFWALAFLVWSSVLLLILLGETFGLRAHSPYLFILVPLVGFFSVGLGAHGYLAAEATIGATLRRHALERADALQREIIPLLDPPWDEASAARLERLTGLHDRIVAGGRYGSRAGQAVSLILPLTLPAIGLIEKLFF